MNTEWTLPNDATLTALERDEVAILAQGQLNNDWKDLILGSDPPQVSPAVVLHVFGAMMGVLSHQGRLRRLGAPMDVGGVG